MANEEETGVPSDGVIRTIILLDELEAALLKLRRKARDKRRITKPKGSRPGDGAGADILGGILGGTVYLQYGGSANLEADNPFNPTSSTPINANPNSP